MSYIYFEGLSLSLSLSLYLSISLSRCYIWHIYRYYIVNMCVCIYMLYTWYM